MPPARSYTYTAEFRDELEVQRLDLLRRRFLWYCGVIIAISLVGLLVGLLGSWFGSKFTRDAILDPAMIVGWIMSGFSVLAYVLAFSWVYRNPQKKEQVYRIAVWLIVGTGLLSLAQGPLIALLGRVGDDGTIRAPGISIREGAGSDGGDITIGPGAGVVKQGDDAAPPPEAGAGVPSPGVPDAAAAAPDEAETLEADAVATPAKPEGEKPRRKISKEDSAVLVMISGLSNILFTHFFACCFLPWTPRESVKPVVPLLAVNAAIMLFYVRQNPVGIPVAIVLSPLVAAPGAFICWWRGSRIRDSFTLNVLKGRYSEIKRELVDARRIHESLFPEPVRDGPVRLDYRYEPMRQIGGDYLYARQIAVPGASQPLTHVIIVDVTGHGITAALTVNRLHGEIDRQLGERPDASPADLLTGLNRYLHHTLANHSVYATALCIRVDAERDRIAWASAGHPPAFIRGSDGTVDQLDSTTLVLGACKGDDFDPNQQEVDFHRGDAIIAYTDGAIECRNEQGRMLGVAGFRGLVASLGVASGEASLDALIRSVDTHRFGPLQDDTLLVEVARPLS